MIQAKGIECQLANQNTQKGYEKNLEFNVANIPKGQMFKQHLHGLGPFGTSMKLVLASLMFTWNQMDPVWIRSALWYQIMSTYEGNSIWNYTVQV